MSILEQIKETGDASQVLLDLTKETYRAAMVAARYNQVKAAKLLQVSRGTLRKKLKEFFGSEFIA